MNNIISEAKSAFLQKDFEACCDVMFRDQQLFVSYLATKANQFFKNPAFADYLWNNFLADITRLEQLLFVEDFSLLVYKYFISPFISVPFEKALLVVSPAEFVIGVRTTESFRKSENLINYNSYEALDQHYSNHLSVWKYLNDEIVYYQAVIEDQATSLQSKSLLHALASFVIWSESHLSISLHKDSLTTMVGDVYNLFVSYLGTVNFTSSVSTGALETSFLQEIDSVSAASSSSQFSFLESLLSWVRFRDEQYTSYCFDLSLALSTFDNQQSLSWSPSAEYSWQVGGFRYKYTDACYLEAARMLMASAIAEGEVMPGNNDFDKQKNKTGSMIRLQSLRFLTDLAFSHVPACGHSISVADLVSFHSVYSFNRNFAYDNKLHGKDGIQPLPYILDEREEILGYCKSLGMARDNSNNLLAFSSFNYDSLKKTGNKINLFSPSFDQRNTPFLQLGSFFFAPLSTFNVDNIFYNLKLSIISQFSKREFKKKNVAHSLAIEGTLSHFLSHSFRDLATIYVATDLTSKFQSTSGDVDVLISDGVDVVIIQVKRTYLRLNAKQVFYEQRMVDKKAAFQLNCAEPQLTKLFPAIVNENTLMHKFIVTTSFENIHSVVDGCIKVNFSEIAIKCKWNKIATVAELAHLLKTDVVELAYQNPALAEAYNVELPLFPSSSRHIQLRRDR